MSPPILLDLSRLLSRARRPTPTGIDRIELAYAEHLIMRAADRLGFVAMNATGELAPVPARIGRQLVETLATAWRDPDAGGRAARVRLLAHLSALLPSHTRSSAVPRRPVYLLVSHQNLHRPAQLARFKARSGAAFVVFLHDLIPMEYPEYVRPGHAERHRLRVETICALADGIIVNSQATAGALAPHLARAGRQLPLLVAHPGSEFAAFLAPPPTPLADERPYFVCLGTIEPRKNHLLLLHLWRHLAATRDATTPSLLLVGRRGWENENTVDLLERCTTIAGLVKEYPALPDNAIPKLLVGARALLCPAFAEGYGLPVAEALVLGVPVICSDIPVFREVGRNVPEFLDPLDGLGWLQAIRDYSAPNSPRRLTQLERLRSWQVPLWEPHIDAVLELIEQLSPDRIASGQQAG